FWKNSTQTTQLFPSKPIDGTATLTSGETIHGPRSLKKALFSKKGLLTQNLAEKLLTYGTGRSISLRDEEEIKQIAKTVNDGQFGFRDLIIKVATSQAFQKK
ncbi:MAG: hypothetical protein CMI29_05795, partial [Opitutae bacterium]|nr:hypothetical protein [Opitutae bacterium]